MDSCGRWLQRGLFALGLLAVGLLLSTVDLREMLGGLRELSWWIVPLLALHGLAIGVDAWAWRMLWPRPRPSTGSLALLRWIREGVNTLLPFAQIGGEVVAARLLAHGRRTPPLPVVSRTLFLDVLLEFLAMNVIAAACLAGLALQAGRLGHSEGALLALSLTAGAVALAVLWLQSTGMPAALASKVKRPRFLAEAFGQLDRGGRSAGSGRPQALASLLLHAAAWAAAAVEVWTALQAIGHPIPFWRALAFETISGVLKTLGFFVPALVGVQEATFLAAGALLGVSSQASLTVAVVRRLRDFALGLPAVVAWRVVARRQAAPADP